MPVSVSPGSANSGSAKKDNQKGSATVPVVIGAVVLLVLLIGWIAYKNLAPPPHASGPTQEAKSDWISEIAIKAGGDFSKVDPAMQVKLNTYTGGKGADLIKSKYQAATH